MTDPTSLLSIRTGPPLLLGRHSNIGKDENLHILSVIPYGDPMRVIVGIKQPLLSLGELGHIIGTVLSSQIIGL